MEAVDKSPEQMLAMFDELDHDKSDTVGFGEFCDCERQSLLEVPRSRASGFTFGVAHEFAAAGVAKKHVTQHLEATATAAEVAAAQTAQASLLSPIADQERGALDKLREEDLPASREGSTNSANSVPGSEGSYNSDSTENERAQLSEAERKRKALKLACRRPDNDSVRIPLRDPINQTNVAVEWHSSLRHQINPSLCFILHSFFCDCALPESK